MAKRELSSTLKNLKFMQRAAQKEAKKDEQEEEKINVQQDSSFGAPSVPVRKCVVIMEGDPHPGAVKGRMSFQSFNPSIDKMNEAAVNAHQEQVKPSSNGHRNSEKADRTNYSNMHATDNEYEVENKRKQPDTDFQPSSSHRLEKDESENSHGRSSSHHGRTGSNKQRKREKKLDWNVLRPPKPEARRA